MTSVTDPIDAELMQRVAAGDAAAFESLYLRHIDQVVRTATGRCSDPHEVADVVAETFLAVWRNADGYDADRGSVAQWISGIAARRFLDLRRGDRRRQALGARAAGRADLHAADLDDITERIDAQRLADAAGPAIGRLPWRQRVVFELVAVDGLTVTAAAGALGMSPSAVSMRLTRARKALQSELTSVLRAGDPPGRPPGRLPLRPTAPESIAAPGGDA